MNASNLNLLYLPDAGDQVDYGCVSGTVSVHFRNLEETLCLLISKAQVIIGCVAWVTNFKILEAMRRVQHQAVVLQKEDLWRPDVGSGRDFKRKIAEYYKGPNNEYFSRSWFTGIGSDLSICHDYSVDRFRCVGNFNRDRKPAHPRMHNKFLVFADISTDMTYHTYKDNGVVHTDVREESVLIPKSVWTGSFNFTKNGGQSFENAVHIQDEKIAKAYSDEFSQIYAFSEPLDWESDWIEPEYRIGT